MLVFYFSLFLAPFLSALGRRVAGGAVQQWTGFNTGDIPVRVFWGMMLAAGAMAAGWPSLALIPATFLGCTCPLRWRFPASWGVADIGSIALGRGDGMSWGRAAVGLEFHGLVGGALLAATAAFFGLSWLPFLIAGAAIVPLYEAAWQIGRCPRLPLGFRECTEIAETLWGYVMGAAAVLTVMT